MALDRFDLRRTVLRAVVSRKFSQKEAALFEDALAVLTSVYKDRNKLAHGIWGCCLDPDADYLLWADPKIFWKLHVTQLRHWSRTKAKIAKGDRAGWIMDQNRPKINQEDMFVYTKTDLSSINDKIGNAHSIMNLIYNLVSAKNPRRRALSQLLRNQPGMKARESRRKEAADREKHIQSLLARFPLRLPK